MAQQMPTRRNRADSPERWQQAAARALAEGIQVRQLAGTGQWIANSGRDASVAYEVQVTGSIAHGCDCLAGLNDDPVCKHRASYYLLVGALSVEPEPAPPAPTAPVPICFRCRGFDPVCPLCAGGGTAYLSAQAAALLVDAA